MSVFSKQAQWPKCLLAQTFFMIPSFKVAWMARNKLPNTKRIVFIGYSFPTTDFYSEWLFRQIYFLQEHRPEIVVVNPEMKKRGSLPAKRHRSLFKGCKIDVYGTLEEFRAVSRDLLRRP
jgi:hypothetical protein